MERKKSRRSKLREAPLSIRALTLQPPVKMMEV
jgi:hypothetical protein